jgi:meiotically up-regulated gene 157 (Mug157) protein
MYAAGALSRLLALNKQLWKCPEVKSRASQLLSDIRQGIRTYGVVAAGDGTRVYAYEVCQVCACVLCMLVLTLLYMLVWGMLNNSTAALVLTSG